MLKETWARFIDDECLTMAAALAYYTIFALPPLLYLLLTIVSFGASLAYEADQANEKAHRVITGYAAELLGSDAAANEIAKILDRNLRQGGVWWWTLVSLTGVLFGASGLMAAVQVSFNRVWRVAPDPRVGSMKTFLLKPIPRLNTTRVDSLRSPDFVSYEPVLAIHFARFSIHLQQTWIANDQRAQWTPAFLLAFLTQTVTLERYPSSLLQSTAPEHLLGK